MTSSESLQDYISGHIDAEDPYLYKLYRESNLYLVRAHMVSGHLQGCLLRMLVSMIKPDLILEIGTYTGYSALSMASGLGKDGRIITYEINDEMEDFTRSRIAASPWVDKVDFHIGDVLHDLPCEIFKERMYFDLVFIDGNKRQYLEYYELSLRYLNPQGYIIVDNTLWDGHVVDTTYNNDAQTKSIKEFNDFVAQDERVRKVILPLRDGLTIIQKM